MAQFTPYHATTASAAAAAAQHQHHQLMQLHQPTVGKKRSLLDSVDGEEPPTVGKKRLVGGVGEEKEGFGDDANGGGGGGGKNNNSSSWRSMFLVDVPADLRPGEHGASFFRPPEVMRAFGFGRQQFRVDMDAPRELSATAPTQFHFKIPRSFDLLNDAHLVFTLPPIWSPVYPPSAETGGRWAPFEFRWIDDLGAQVVTEVRITAGNQQLALYSGDYLSTVARRDYDATRYAAFCDLTGNVPEVNDPASAHGRGGCYPSAFVTATTDPTLGTQPSVDGRVVRVPLGAWFAQSSQMAMPLVCLSESIDFVVSVTLRPLQDWFRARDVFDPVNDFPMCRPDFNSLPFQLHRFLQSPPQADASQAYPNTTNYWNADVFLEVTGSFLTQYERDQIAHSPQRYLVRDVKVYTQDAVAGSALIKLESVGGMVSGWTWHLSRSDVAARNEWANHTNWPYLNRPPAGLVPAPAFSDFPALNNLGPRMNPPPSQGGGAAANTGIFLSGDATDVNRKQILATNAVLFNGEYLESDFPTSTWNRGLRYSGSRITRDDSLFAYAFALHPGAESEQFSGGRDTSRISRVQLKMSVFPPPLNTSRAGQTVVCDADGNIISVNAVPGGQFQYTYNIVIFEERYNFIEIAGGFAGLAVAT